MPYAGEILPLSFQLLDSDSSKFCRAVLKEPDGTPLPESPVSLVNIGGGKYTSDAVVMPTIDYVEATYESFDDAGFTVPDEDHLVGTDVFRLEVPDSVIVNKLDQIIAKLDGLALPGAMINATLVQSRIKEVVQDIKAVKGLVEHDDIKGIISADPKIISKVDDQEISTTIDCNRG